MESEKMTGKKQKVSTCPQCGNPERENKELLYIRMKSGKFEAVAWHCMLCGKVHFDHTGINETKAKEG
jgi:uncharacterized Zn finger protein